MKTMNCRQLGGACDQEFQGDTFEEIAELSKLHGMQMFQQQDSAHLAAMQEMQGLIRNPEEMRKWFESKRQEFESLL